MRLNKFLFVAATVVVAMVFLLTSAQAQTQVTPYAGVVLFIQDNLTGSDTLLCGFGRAATYCTDGTMEFTFGGMSVKEYGLPPLPPSGVFDTRFIDSRSGTGGCPDSTKLDQGIPHNFHESLRGTTFADTFRVSFQGSASDGSQNPFHLSWIVVAPDSFGTLSLKYTHPDDGPITVDMLTNSSHDIPLSAPDIPNFRIIGSNIKYEGVFQISDAVPQTFALNQNYPNPFNPTTTINFAILKASDVSIAVYDMLGRKISSLVSENVSPGFFSTTWNGLTENGTPAASGTYYVRMNAKYENADGAADEFVSVQKIVLMK
ncbi:MAG: T9SS type A sorting domain-containing protein [Bacteroidetes bacterium]|nr:MAG: T9SS type A sorting domain-containing protein [Bacteroidota bacterium]